MLDKDILEKTDEQLWGYIERALKGELPLDLLHDETPSYVIFDLYQSQTDYRQRKRIKNVIYSILQDNFVHRIINKLDEESDEFLGNLGFVAESLKIKESYNIFRSLIDRGSLGSGPSLFYKKDTEKKILRTLMALQPPKLLIGSIWKLYWDAEDPFFWNVAFLGIRRSDADLAVSLLYEGYKRWRKDNIDFDFAQALWEIANSTKDKKALQRIGKFLTGIDPEQISWVETIMTRKGMSLSRLQLILPSLKSTYTLNNRIIFREQPFYIYYHRDMDGIASTVLLTLFLTKKYKQSAKHIKTLPTDFDDMSIWSKTVEKHQPAAVLDFLYHKDAVIYYSHQHNMFINSEFRRHFAERRFRDKYVQLHEDAISTTEMVFSDLKDFFQGEFSSRFKKIEEMVRQINKIDSARYSSPKGWLNGNFACAKINLILHTNRTDTFSNQLVKDLLEKDCDELSERDNYKKLFMEAKNKIEGEQEQIKDRLRVLDSVVFYDAAKYAIPFHRFLAYDMYPNARFVVAIYPKGEDYTVSVGRNPWKYKKFQINIGTLCESFGGGGHKNVGGVTFDNYKKAYTVSQRVVSMLKASR